MYRRTLNPLPDGGLESGWGRVIFRLYGPSGRRVRSALRSALWKLEGRDVRSTTLRRIMAAHHGVDIGMYSHGGCFRIGHFAPGTVIGRYCSIAVTAQAFAANHPMNLRSSHALFYNPCFGYVERDLLTRTRLTVGNDVWMGHNSIILPSVSRIGDGAIIGAGSIVGKDVPPYAVMTGNPARVVRYRFEQSTIDEIMASRWWEKNVEELLPHIKLFQTPVEGGDIIR